MSPQLRKILSYVFLALPAAMVVMAGLVKITGNPEVSANLAKVGMGSYVFIIGLSELLAAVLLFFRKTEKVAFFFMLSFLGGAAAADLAMGTFPIPMILIGMLWIGMFLRHNEMFLPESENAPKASHA